ncbi:MAG: hypothetical protein ACE5R6_21890 [Candidatus Heimdallarchaeota archaeon]
MSDLHSGSGHPATLSELTPQGGPLPELKNSIFPSAQKTAFSFYSVNMPFRSVRVLIPCYGFLPGTYHEAEKVSGSLGPSISTKPKLGPSYL